MDDGLVELKDLGVNFYLSEDQVGKVKRSEATLPKLQDLNP